MDTIIATLLSARDTAHILHLSTKRFSAHLALGDLYDEIVDLSDSLAEMHQGKYGILNISPAQLSSSFNSTDAVTFIRELSTWAESAKLSLPEDSFIQNEWDNVLTTIYKAKYKLENLV